MRLILCSQVFLVLILSWGCSGPKVIAFRGSNPDLSSYFTFRVKHQIAPKDTDTAAFMLINKVENSILAQMNNYGYEMTSVADLVVEYNLVLSSKVDYRVDNSYQNRYDYNSYTYPYYRVNKREYTEGTLLVEVREDFSRKLVWQASLDMKYNKKRSSKKKADPVKNAFDLIFAEYPFRAGSSETHISEGIN